jgi:hypothetical protein
MNLETKFTARKLSRSLQVKERVKQMQFGESIPSGAVLDAWLDGLWTNRVQVDGKKDMEKLIIQTRNTICEIIVIDRLIGEIPARGGPFFPELTPAHLARATLGGSFCKMRGIYAGFGMEINGNGSRTVGSPVESIGVLA